MKTLTIRVPDALHASLEAAAGIRRQAKTALARELLEKGLAGRKAKGGKAAGASLHDKLNKYQGAGPAGIRDLASNPKHLAGYGR